MGLNFIGCLDDNEEEVEGSAVAVGGVVVEVLGTVMFLRRGSSNLAELDKVLGSVELDKNPVVTVINMSKLDSLLVEVPAVPN